MNTVSSISRQLVVNGHQLVVNCQLVVNWSAIGRQLVVNWSSIGRQLVINWSSIGRQLVINWSSIVNKKKQTPQKTEN